MTSDLVGQRLGQYEILAVLGKGGMATVYRARQPSIGRDVAIKVIKPELAETSGVLERFQREAAMIATLSHLHILKVFDYGQQDDMVYLVMELLAGGSLSDLIAKGALPIPAVTRLIEQIGQALDYAHQRGIIHRDLKPQNVLLDDAQNAFLTDFGIAKMIGNSNAMTQTGMVMGTPAYMAPEQWSGGMVDARTDLYAMGIMLFQMLTGNLPYDGDTPFRIMHMHIYEEPPSIVTANPVIPRSIEKVINKAIAKNREDRYESAEAMVKAFKKAAESGPAPTLELLEIASEPGAATSTASLEAAPKTPIVPILQPATNPPAPPAAPPARPQPASKRSPLLPIGIIGALVIIAVIMGLIVANRGGPLAVAAVPSATATNTATSTQTSIPTQTATLTASTPPDNTRTSTATQSPVPTITNTPSQTPDLNETGIALVGSTNTAIAAAATKTATPTLPPTASATNTLLPTFEFGTRKIAFATNRDGNPEIYTMDASGKNLVNLTKNPAVDTAPSWSPDGKKIAFSSTRAGKSQIFVMNADGSNPVNLSKNDFYDYEPAWSPDGQHIAFYSGRDSNYQIYVMKADGSTQTRLTKNNYADISPEWSPGSERLIFVSNRDDINQIYIMNADGSGQTRVTRDGFINTHPSWSPDGRQILYITQRGGTNHIAIMEADGSKSHTILNGSVAQDYPSWLPDNKQWLYVEKANTAHPAITLRGAGEPFTLLDNGTGEAYPVVQPAP